MASQAAMNQPTRTFMIHCPLTGMLPVRILFEEPPKEPPFETGGLSMCLHRMSPQ